MQTNDHLEMKQITKAERDSGYNKTLMTDSSTTCKYLGV